MHLFIIVCIWLCVVYYTNVYISRCNLHIAHYQKGNAPLWDIIHSNNGVFSFERWFKYKWVTDVFVVLCFLCVDQYHSFFISHSILILLRCMCANVTVLPPIQGIQPRSSFGLLDVNYQYDYIFSGHVCICYLSSLCSYEYGGWAFILSLICSFTSVVTREHYTIDIFVSYMATYCVSHLYCIYSSPIIT